MHLLALSQSAEQMKRGRENPFRIFAPSRFPCVIFLHNTTYFLICKSFFYFKLSDYLSIYIFNCYYQYFIAFQEIKRYLSEFSSKRYLFLSKYVHLHLFKEDLHFSKTALDCFAHSLHSGRLILTVTDQGDLGTGLDACCHYV